jgi:DNA-directed RNA polymerase sigma subunit (sigma70/sigma32)
MILWEQLTAIEQRITSAKVGRCGERSRQRRVDNAAVRRFVGNELAGSGLLDVLPKREQIIILARFGLENGKPKTLEELGKQFGVTRERIRQLQNDALSKLRRARAALKSDIASRRQKVECQILQRVPIEHPGITSA